MKNIFINGKFFGQPTTGAQRFATEIVLALDSVLSDIAESESCNFVLLVPSGVLGNIPPLKQIRVVELAGFSSHLWEQVRLPLFVRDSFLINLSGSAPMFKRKQIFTIFDAAIFDFPQAYSKMFLAWYRLLFRVQTRFCYGLMTISEYSRDRLSMHLGVGKERFSLVPCGVDHIYRTASDESIFEKYGLHKNGYLLAVGSANPSKNFSALIRAFTGLRNAESIRLVVVGGSNPAVFAEQNVIDNLHIVRTGRVDDLQLKALYTHARGFVFPSLYEGFGIPPLEAMACGCPVVASNLNSILEVCGSAIGYFDPTSISSIQNALERIIDDGSWRERLQVAGRDMVKQYTWEAAANQLLCHLRRTGVICY
ncbi:MAG: glycosyltransferase family 4 protein [Rhodoferax sp.]|uniref:glycosyltransferase family 4 protein n=1 Tax=Rhodoferax sp. TaxID=50421 RepID=UPI00184231B1|nr:glycosyltransferase family 1 protein [Rhodoferax sp.]NMM20420.1 glycosyltransferase family 4 protein [Rhodoferax sp.]